MYLIERIHSPIDAFSDFCLNKSKLRVFLIKVHFGEFEKVRKFPKHAQKNA